MLQMRKLRSLQDTHSQARTEPHAMAFTIRHDANENWHQIVILLIAIKLTRISFNRPK